MNQILLFKSNGHEFPLEIISRNEEKWVTRKQLSIAMGVSNLRELHSQLVKKEELKEGTHFITITVMYPDGNSVRGNPSMIVYSYRGIIRVSMHCEGKYAKQFRDWAEDVLYEVMITGTYLGNEHSEKPNTQPLCSSLGRMAEDDVALEKMFRKRKEGLTEIGFGGTVSVQKAIDSICKDTGIDLKKRWGFEFTEVGENVVLPKNNTVLNGSTTKKLPKVESGHSEVNIPKSYRGWNLNKRGTNKKGQTLFNLVKKIDGKRLQKYLGIWNQEKADKLINKLESAK
jgi:prophage antirepressor-like protein